MEKVDLYSGYEGIFQEIINEQKRAATIHREYFVSIDEALGVISEEYEEVKVEFRKSHENKPELNTRLRVELIQLAAMCRKAIASYDNMVRIKHKDANYYHCTNIFDRSMLDNSNMDFRTTMEASGHITIKFHSLMKAADDMIQADEKEIGQKGVTMKTNDVLVAIQYLGIACLSSVYDCCRLERVN